jgi:hypothetical protein
MTVEEFYQSTDFPELDKHDRKAATFTYYDMLDFSERYAGQKAKEVRHAAAEIALTVGGERDANEAHRDIMNLKFELT